jgi:hypothetical protein
MKTNLPEHILYYYLSRYTLLIITNSFFVAWVVGPKEQVTDPDLLRVGVRAQGMLKGGYAPKGYQKLHPGTLNRATTSSIPTDVL